MQNFSLSYMQESQWVLHQLDPASTAYNEATLLRLTGRLDAGALENALNALLERHAILRTAYRSSGISASPADETKDDTDPLQGDDPRQVVLAPARLALPLEDLSHLPAGQRGQAALHRVQEIAYQPFDLANGPPLRSGLFKLGAEEHLLVIAIHHIAFDGWSRQILIGDLAAAYEAYSQGREPALSAPGKPYGEFALWQRDWLQGERLARLLDHWQKEMAGDLPVLDLPLDHARPSRPAYQGARHFFDLPAELIADIRALCQRERLSLFTVMAAAYALLLSRYSGQDEIILGCPFANRMKLESRNNWDDTLGMFVNTLPLRVGLQGDVLTVRQLLRRVRDIVLDAFSNQALPFKLLVSHLQAGRAPGRNPIFQTLINLRNVPPRGHSPEGLRIEEVAEPAPGPNFDLSLELDENPGRLRCALRYDTALFEADSIARMAGHFENLLRGIVDQPDAEVNALEILTPAERHQILIQWNQTEADRPPACLHELAERAAEADPGTTAVICNAESLTYADLLSRAGRLADYLQAHSIGKGAILGLYLPRSADLIVAQLAVLKADAAYLALDLSYPPERNRFILEDARPDAVITLERLAAGLPPGAELILLDSEAASIAATPAGLASAYNPHSPAYISYTSGSTGRPKGAVTLHRGAANYIVDMVAARRLQPGERVLQFTSPSFDASVRDTLGTLAFGGTIILLDDEQARDPAALLAVLKVIKAEVILSIVPTMLRAFADAALEAGFINETLRLIMVSGEVLTTADVAKVRHAFGERVEIVNQYGPTECSMIATTYTVPAQNRDGQFSLPIGRPISNVRVYVLDQHLQPLPPGARGELFIGGVGIGGGYLNRPELTEANFLLDPFFPSSRMYRTGDLASYLPDGTIQFWGRRDAQVKLRGNRVELGEVEAALMRHPLVKDAAVVLAGEPPEGAFLAAYVVPTSGAGVPTDLKDFAASWLPNTMVPVAWVALESLPLLPNNKIDSRRLPPLERPSGLIPPRTETERRLVDIWQVVLGENDFGVNDDFFALGGDSISAIRIIGRINDAFQSNLSIRDMLEAPTIAETARLIDGLDA